MATVARLAGADLIQRLTQQHYLFRGLDQNWLSEVLLPLNLSAEKLYSNRPVYTANRPGEYLEVLYVIRSSPLDRIIGLTYPGSSFGMRSLPLAYGLVGHAFPSLVEAYKTTDIVKIPVAAVQICYEQNEVFRDRYNLLFELREKFQYHLLNCSTYPPQAVAALLRALVYQERSLGNQPDESGVYRFDLPVDIIARACQLNHRTVEQVLKGMQKVRILAPAEADEVSEDWVRVVDPEGLKEAYSATKWPKP